MAAANALEMLREDETIGNIPATGTEQTAAGGPNREQMELSSRPQVSRTENDLLVISSDDDDDGLRDDNNGFR